MRRYSNSLGTIHCRTSKATVDALVSRFGLHARPAGEPHHFDIFSRGRASEPEVDGDLFDLALATLRSAERDGSLPLWSVVANVMRNTNAQLALTMWFVYRFARDAHAAATMPVRQIDNDVAAFSNAIAKQVHGRWIAPSARAPDGGVEVWYNLPHLPSESALEDMWAKCLGAYALTGRRITNR